jgi:hypothetical protein
MSNPNKQKLELDQNEEITTHQANPSYAADSSGITGRVPGEGEGEGEEEAPAITILTTDKVVPVRTISRGCLALTNNQVSTVLKIDGVDSRLMSGLEKQALVQRLAGLFNTLTSPFAIYYVSKPRDMRPYLEDLDRKRAADPNPNLRNEYFTIRDELVRLNRENQITQRDYYLTVQATPTDLKAGEQAAEAEAEEEGPAASFWQKKAEEIQRVILGKDLAQEKLKAASSEAGQSEKAGINQALAETLRFRGQSFASQARFGGRVLSDEELTRLLGELWASPLAERKDLRPVHRLGGARLLETAHYLKLGDQYLATLYITDFPQTMRLRALFEILRLKDVQLCLGLHVTPVATSKAESKLRQRQSMLHAVSANGQSSVGDMGLQHKIESISLMRAILARGEAKLFSVGVRISIRAKTKKKLLNDLRQVSQRLVDMGYSVAKATNNQRRGFLSSIPLGHDWLGEKILAERTLHPNLTGENVACLLPNCIVDFTVSGGIIQGVSKADGSLITYNRRSGVNPHSVFCATSGAGKTFAQMIEILLELMAHPKQECFYIDPQGVFGRFATIVGGTVIDMGPKGKAIINPVDKYVLNGKPEEVIERLPFLIPLLEIMLKSELNATDRSSFTRAIKRLYAHFEEGENFLPVLERSYATQIIYSPLQPFIRDYQDGEGKWQEGVITKLSRIYAFLKEKYRLPATGLVRGLAGGAVVRRPICHLVEGRWYYRGDGETDQPLIEREAEYWERVPAAVWYPERGWLRSLMQEFQQLVTKEQVFASLDRAGQASAMREAFVGLKLGMPILEDLLPFLAAEGLTTIVSNLEPFVDREVYGPLFNGYTNVQLERRFICFNVRDLTDDVLKSIRIFQIINYTWGLVRGRKEPGKPVIPVIFTVDELGVLLKTFPEIGDYLSTLFMRGRAFGLAMTVIVQNMSSLLDHKNIRECVENAQRIVLLKQDQAAVPRIQVEYQLTDGQVMTLIDASPGEGLQRVNGKWVHFSYEVPAVYRRAWETNPDSGQDHEPEEGQAGSSGKAVKAKAEGVSALAA